jgi:hypothetical protein
MEIKGRLKKQKHDDINRFNDHKRSRDEFAGLSHDSFADLTARDYRGCCPLCGDLRSERPLA